MVHGHADFGYAFSTGKVFRDGDVIIEIAETPLIASLAIVTGRLLVGDPSALDGNESQQAILDIPKGTFDVKVAIAKIRVGESMDHRIVCARLQLAAGIATSWIPARCARSDAMRNNVATIATDSGLGCFADANILTLLSQADRITLYQDALLPRLSRESIGGCRFGSAAYGASSDCLVAFACGYGDGAYPCFFGLDEGGRQVSLDVDCGILTTQPLIRVELGMIRSLEDRTVPVLQRTLRLKVGYDPAQPTSAEVFIAADSYHDFAGIQVLIKCGDRLLEWSEMRVVGDELYLAFRSSFPIGEGCLVLEYLGVPVPLKVDGDFGDAPRDVS